MTLTAYPALFPLAPLQVLTHTIVGAGSTIGERLLAFPGTKLVIGDRVPTAYHDELQALLDQCGRVNGEERPGMELVLQSVNGVLRSVRTAPVSVGELLLV